MVQNKTNMDWDDYRFFLMVARTPSIRAAAIKLDVSHSTVLRRLDRLEDLLGARLFERNTVGFRLTAAGEDVVQGASEVEESIQSIDRMVTGRDSALEGRVKITMPEVFDHPSIFPDLRDFKAQFPNIIPEVDLSYSLADLSKREADIAIRCTNQPPEDLVGRNIGEFKMAPYATQDYIDRFDPLTPGSAGGMLAWGNPELWQPRHGLDHLGAVGFFDNILLQVHLAKASLGVASLPTLIADDEPGLIQIGEADLFTNIWVLYHTDLRYTSRVRVVRDYLLDWFSTRLEQIYS